MVNEYDALIAEDLKKNNTQSFQADASETNEYDNIIQEDLNRSRSINYSESSLSNTSTETWLRQLSEKTSIPIEALRDDSQTAERIYYKNNYEKLVETSPKVASLMQDRSMANLAADNVDSLSEFERLLEVYKTANPEGFDVRGDFEAGKDVEFVPGQFALSAGRQIVAGALSMPVKTAATMSAAMIANAFVSPEAELYDPSETTQELFARLHAGDRAAKEVIEEYGINKLYDIGQQVQDYVGGKEDLAKYTWASNAMLSGFKSIGDMFPGLLATIATRNPGIVISSLSAFSGGETFMQDIKKGKPVWHATAHGVAEGGIEAITEVVPILRVLESKEAGKTFLEAFLHAAPSEVISEEMATILQSLADVVADKKPEKSWGDAVADWLSELPAMMAETALASLFTVGGMTALSNPPRVRSALREVQEFNRNATEIAKAFKTNAGQKIGGVFSKEQAQSEQARKDVTQMVEKISEDADITHAYIDRETFDTYFQTADINPVDAAKEFGVTNYDEDSGYVQIPIAVYQAGLSATEHAAHLVNDTKFRPEGLTENELLAEQEFREQNKQELQDVINRAETEYTINNTEAGLAEKLADKIAIQLSNRFDKKSAKAQAQIPSRALVNILSREVRQQAVEAGEDLTEEELIKRIEEKINSYNLNIISNATESQLKPGNVSPMFDSLLEKLRSGFAHSEKAIYGESLTDYARAVYGDKWKDIRQYINKAIKEGNVDSADIELLLDGDILAAEYGIDESSNVFDYLVQEAAGEKKYYKRSDFREDLFVENQRLDELQQQLFDAGIDITAPEYVNDNAKVRQMLQQHFEQKHHFQRGFALEDTAEAQEEANRQYDEVVSKYKGTDAWLKAPNGEPSNLNERQWVQVRTENFKKWFGDWEAAEKINVVKNQPSIEVQPIANLEKKELEGIFQRIGVIQNRFDGINVRFPNTTAGKLLRHKNKPVLLIANNLREIFENAIPAYSEKERIMDGHKKHNNINAYHNYVAKILVNENGENAEYFVRFTVTEEHQGKTKQKQENKVHSFFVSNVMLYKSKNGRFDNGPDWFSDPEEFVSLPFDIRLANWFDSVNSSVSKVVDENGEPLVVYHGTPTGTFDVFNPESYFTANPDYAKRYENPTASSLYHAAGRDVFSPKTYAVFLNIKKPFDTRNEAEREIFEKEFFRQWGNGAPLSERGLPDWTDGSDFIEFFEENDYDYDGFILDEGGDGGYGENVRLRGESYVIRNPNQVKSATDNTGLFNPDNPNILYQSETGVSQFPLMAVHNLSADNLIFSEEMGGVAVPSVGVVGAEQGGVNGFGEITLIGTKDIADPEKNPVFSSDAYTATFPRPEYKPVPMKKREFLAKLFKDVDNVLGRRVALSLDNCIDSTPDRNRFEYILNINEESRLAFLKSIGIEIPMLEKEMGRRSLIKTDADLLEIKPFVDAVNWETTDVESPEYKAMAAKYAEIVTRNYKAKGAFKWLKERSEMPLSVADKVRYDVENIGKKELDTLGIAKVIDQELEGRELEFKAWTTKIANDIFGEPYLRKGNKLVPYTLENIVDVMTSKDVKNKGETPFFTTGQARASASIRFKNLEEAREVAKKSMVDPEKYEKAKEETETVLEKYRDEITNYSNIKNWKGDIDIFESMDASMRAIARYLKGSKKGVSAFKAALKKEGFSTEIPNEVINQSINAAEALIKAPVPYFESKPQRIVRLDEFAGAVVPKKLPENARKILEKNGIKVFEYDEDENKLEITRKAARELNNEQRQTLFQSGIEQDKTLINAAKAYMKLAENDDMFTYPVMRGSDLTAEEKNAQGLYFDNFVSLYKEKTKNKYHKDFKGVTWEISPIHRIDELRHIDHYEGSYRAKGADNSKARIDVYQENGRYYYSIDASGLTSGGSRGSELITLLSNFVLNTGGIFEGDRHETEEKGNAAGYTEMGEKRAFELMLSSALRFQTTRHIKPSKHLLDVLKKEGHQWKDTTDRNLTYEERQEKDIENISYLIDITYKNALSAIPEIANFRYNINSDSFEKKLKNGWKEVEEDAIQIRKTSKARAEEAGIGGKTLKRALLVNALISSSKDTGMVSGKRQGRRDEILASSASDSTAAKLDKTTGRVIPIKDTLLYRVLYQSSKAEMPRGAIQVAPNNTFNIHLFEKADFSTLAHESSHFFLQVMIDLENAPNASGYIRSEMAKVRKWLGNTGEDISVEQHEKFARGFEQYLKEGKAPAPELRNIFRLFKQWLVKIYDGIKRSLNVKINDEIREVFDRILASDIEIEAAKKYHGIKPIFATPDEIGVTQEEFDAYVNLSKDSIEQAKEKLLQQLMKSQTRKATKEYKDLLVKATKEAEKEFDDTREARALNALTESEDRTTAVDSGSLSDYHKKIINSVQKMNGRKFHDRAGQRNIEDVAEEYGFNSGDELMTALTNLMPKKQYVENRAKEIVREREGDLLNSVTIAEEAEKALYSAEGREMLHKKELAVLQYMASIGDVGAKATEQQRSQELKRAKAIERGINALYGDMKLSAKEIISKKAVKEVKPSAYLAASRKYANKAKQALNKVNPDYVLAASCKRQQIMNECLYREARDAREQMEKEQARIRYIAKRPFEKYKNTRDHFGVLKAKFIAAKCGLGGNPEAIAKQMNEEKSVSGNGEAGYGFLDESIEYDAIGNYKNMSVAEFLYIASAIRAEYDMARRDKVVEIEGRRIEVEQAAGEVAEAINAYAESSNVIKTNRQENARNSLLRLIANEMLSLTRMEECCIRIDGVSYKRGEKLGPMMRLVYLPIKNAADRVRIKQQEYFKRLSEIVDEFGFRQETIDARELGYVFGKDTGYGKAELIHALLHTGNESNLERLILGGGGENNAWGTKDRETGYLDASRWNAFIARMIEEGRLTKEDFDRVQKIWDIFEDLKPDSQKAHKEVFGKTFSEITARPFSMMGTVYKGGYVPAIYDYKKTGTGEKQNESLTVESLINNTGLAMPKPQASWGKERVSGYYAPLLFDMSALKEHLRRQILFSGMAPVNRDVQKILNRSNVDKAFREYNPDFKRDVIKPFMSRAITQSMETGTNENSALNKIGRQLRMRAGVAAMFANVANVIEQATDMIAVFTIINKKYVYDAFSTVFSNKNEVIGKIMEESVYMRNRIDSEVMAANGRLEVALNPGRLRKADKWIQDHAYFMQSWLDRYLSSVVWTAAYNQATAGGNSHAESVQIADSSVRRVLGANAAEDVSNFESGGAWKRVFTQFCGYFVQRANLVATELSTEKRHAGTTKQDIANLRAAQAMIVLSSVFMTAWVGAAIRLIASGGGYGDDDDRNFTTWLVDVFGWGSLDYVFSMGGWAGKGLQTFKDIGRSWTTGQSYNSGRLFTPPAIALIDNFAKSVYSLSSKRKPADEKVGDIIVDASRLMPGVPVLPNRVTGSAEYIMDTMQGEVRPRDAYDFARGVVTGRPSKGTEVR